MRVCAQTAAEDIIIIITATTTTITTTIYSYFIIIITYTDQVFVCAQSEAEDMLFFDSAAYEDGGVEASAGEDQVRPGTSAVYR